MCYTILVTIYMIYMLDDTDDLTDADILVKIVLSLLILLLWTRQVYFEIIQLYNDGFVDYFRSLWNYNDIANYSLTAFVIVVNSFFKDDLIEMDLLRAIAAVTIALVILKCFDWLRLFEKTAFYVLLMRRTFGDMIWFMLLILLTFFMLGLPMVLLN